MINNNLYKKYEWIEENDYSIINKYIKYYM